MKAFLEGLLYAILLVALILSLLAMSACATGVQMSDEERIACRDAGCTPWTEAELRDLVQRAVTGGYRKGWTDATRQAGVGI